MLITSPGKMQTFQIKKIVSKNYLADVIKFIHKNNFSPETTIEKVCNNFDGRILGLTINNENNEIIASIFYYYQPPVEINNINYKVINFSTIYIKKDYRGMGILTLMLNKTKEIFTDYIITEYTPVPKVTYLLLKMGFGYMKNNRSLVLPIPKPKYLLEMKIAKLEKINDHEIKNEVFNQLESYRKYEITLWRYKNKNIDVLLGTTFKSHLRDFLKLKIKTSSVRILWTSNEKILLEEANNIAFLFFLKTGHKFITIDCEDSKRPFFSFKLNNQFMTFPKLNVKISPIGSEFFSGVI